MYICGTKHIHSPPVLKLYLFSCHARKLTVHLGFFATCGFSNHVAKSKSRETVRNFERRAFFGTFSLDVRTRLILKLPVYHHSDQFAIVVLEIYSTERLNCDCVEFCSSGSSNSIPCIATSRPYSHGKRELKAIVETRDGYTAIILRFGKPKRRDYSIV